MEKSDIANLMSLGVSDVALRRMKHLTGTGRPTVKPHRLFADEVADKLSAIKRLPIQMCRRKIAARRLGRNLGGHIVSKHFTEANTH